MASSASEVGDLLIRTYTRETWFLPYETAFDQFLGDQEDARATHFVAKVDHEARSVTLEPVPAPVEAPKVPAAVAAPAVGLAWLIERRRRVGGL